MTISIERHMRNKKSQRMGILNIDLTEHVFVENPVVNKKMKLEIEEGPFELGTLRCYLSSKFAPDGDGRYVCMCMCVCVCMFMCVCVNVYV